VSDLTVAVVASCYYIQIDAGNATLMLDAL
jgi:hypothetical protein